MTVGNQASPAGISSALSQYAIGLRDQLQRITNLNTFVNGQGNGTAALVALGFSSQDAATVITLLSYMNTIAEVYDGVQFQGNTANDCVQFDFDNALSILWAGQ